MSQLNKVQSPELRMKDLKYRQVNESTESNNDNVPNSITRFYKTLRSKPDQPNFVIC